MRSPRTSALLILVLAVGALAGCGDDPAAPTGPQPYADCAEAVPYVPTAGWRSVCPGAVGLDTTRLRFGLQEVETRMPSLLALVVARRGYVALEAYWGGTRATTPLEIRSITKSFTATVVATEIQAGRIARVDVPLSTWWPWLGESADTRYGRLHVGHLLNLSAGYQMAADGTVNEDVATWALSRPLFAEPGERWQYDEASYAVLSYLVRKVDPRGMRDAARADLFGPLGIAGAASRWRVDSRGNAQGASGLKLTARELLSLGELYRRDGVWDGRQVLPAGWVARIRERPDGVTPTQELWIRGWRQVVLDGHLTLYTMGHGGQYLIVVPDLELVVVGAARPDGTPQSWPQVLSLVRDHVIPAAS